MSERDLIVVKYGSASVTNQHGVDSLRINNYARDIASISERYDFIVVSSGAIATGRSLWLDTHSDKPEPTEQSLAVLGSDELTTAWKRAFRGQDILAGPIAVTHRDLDDKEAGDMLSRVIKSNLAAGIISIFNENDALSDVEIAALSYGGDNDGLAQHIALKAQADHLCLMTDVEGLIDNNGRIVQIVDKSNRKKALKWADKENFKGRGGMKSKVKNGIRAAEAGTTGHIAHATSASLQEVITSKTGTHFPKQ